MRRRPKQQEQPFIFCPEMMGIESWERLGKAGKSWCYMML